MTEQTVFDYYGTGYSNPQFLAGTEYEIEAVLCHDHVGPPFSIISDGSLRNTGYEYITSPLSYEGSLEAFKYLFTKLQYKKEVGHSERTSTHVHINVGSLTLKQCKQLILLYAALEPLFFNYVAPNRKDNIFCVPLSYTHLSKFYNKELSPLLECWHKYTAFNILPMREYGTMEFRHLQGTNDYETYHGWLTSLKNLFEFVRDNKDFNILEYLKSGKSVIELTSIVPILKEKVASSNLQSLLYDSTLDVKLSYGALDA